MKNIFLKSELCIGTAGITVFERCLLQVPSLLICFDEKQRFVLDEFIKSDVTKYIGTIKEDYLDKIEKNILEYYYDNLKLIKTKEKCKNYFSKDILLKFSFNINYIFKNKI